MRWIDELNKLNKQSWLLIQGMIILMTLGAILIYFIDLKQMQEDIKDDCGWQPEDTVQCACTKTAWLNYKEGLELNFTENTNGLPKISSP